MNTVSSAKADMKEAFAPDQIITASAGVAVNVTGMRAIGSPNSYEYFIDDASGFKVTRTGVIWINAKVKTVTFTAGDNFEVMTL